MAKTQSIWNFDFWAGAGERALATFSQTLVALIGVDTIAPVWGLDWAHLLGAAALSALLSLLKSVGAGAVTGSASVGHLEDPAPPKGGGRNPSVDGGKA